MAWVLNPTNKLLLRWLDANGKHATTTFNLQDTETDPTAGGAAAISSSAAALSNSALIATEIQIVATNDSPGSPTTGPYQRPADKASYVLSSDDGTRPRLEIGSPQESQFPDSWNIDLTATDPAALIAALVAHGSTASGGSITGAISGQRRRPPRRKGQ